LNSNNELGLGKEKIMNITNKTFVVTGGGNGIGRELVLQLLQNGARVAAVDIDAKALEETRNLVELHAEKLSLHALNITDRSAVEALPASVLAAHGTVDGLINNAGIIQHFVRFNELLMSEVERVMNVNFYGTLYLTKAFLPYFLERPEAHIVNVSSMGGFLPVPGQTIYGASKAAMKLFTEGLHSELLDTKVGVTIVFPGAIGTNIAANSGIKVMTGQEDAKAKYKTTSPVVAAAQIISAIEQKKYRVLIGSDAKMMDFLSRLMPERAAKIIYTQMKALLDSQRKPHVKTDSSHQPRSV
jgi:short-subunit dehydrogenase